jgi:hypothetical protein
MKKESIGRLLLTLITAFVMVSGVFGAANWSDTQSDDRTDQIADGDFDLENGETGDAPVSAIDSDSVISEVSTSPITDSPQNDDRIVTDPIELRSPNGYVNEDIVSESDDVVEAHGTRAATVDANGPYGEFPPGFPYYEGETVPFDGTIVGGDPANYYFRWDVTGDGNYEMNHFPASWGGDDVKGVADFDHEYRDNFVGEGTLEAWDGSAMRLGPDGDMLDGLYYDGSYWLPVPRFYQNPPPNGRDGTWGLQFDVYKDCTVDQMGFVRTYAPTPYLMRLWDMSTSTCIGVNFQMRPYISYGWNWYTIKDPANPFGPDITLDLDAGKSYMVTTHMYYSDGRFPRNANPGPTSDGVMEPITSWFNYGGDSYPTNRRDGYIVLMDVHYMTMEPDVLEGKADIFVDNIAPVAQNAVAIGEPGQEGSEIGFTAEFYDIGLDDEWEFRWTFGDGEDSGWIPINKWSGGGKVLMATTWGPDEEPIGDRLSDELGNWLVELAYFNWGPTGQSSPPDLDLMLQYDVVIVGTNYIPSAALASDMGDRLAEYVDAGGNVVQMWSSFHTSDRITGRWTDEEYLTIERGGLRFGDLNMNNVYDPTQPIMNGGSSVTSYYNHYSYDATTHATLLADYQFGYVCAAYNDMNHPNAPTSRIVGLSMFPTDVGGDAWTMIANAVKWASQNPDDPEVLPMPITLETIYHTYVDDHPTSVTPEDTFDVFVEVRDDDDGNVVGQPGDTIDWTNNIALAPNAEATHGGGGSGVWGPHRLNNGDKIGLYNDCWTTDNPPLNWNQLTWPSAVYVAASKDYWSRWRPTLSYRYALKAFDFQYWDGSAWVTLVSFDDGQPFTKVDHTLTLPDPVLTTAVRYANMVSKYGPPYNIMIQEWEIFGVELLNPYEMDGLSDPAFTTVLIENVFPQADNELGVILDVNENTPMGFEGFQIVDPARGEDTEDFRYRWDFDDGTPRGPWRSMVGTETMYEDFETGSGWPWSPWVTLGAGTAVTSAAAHDGSYGLEIDDPGFSGFAYRTDVSVGNPGDIISMWARPSGNGNGGRAYLGFAATSTGSYSFTLAYNTNQILIHRMQPYGSFSIVATSSFGGWQPDKWYRAEIEFISTTEVICRLFDSDGTTLLQDVSYSSVVGAPGGISMRGFYLWSVDTINDGGTAVHIPTEYHNFMDNGVYDVHLEVIDDDMMWDFSGGDPVFTGAPGTEEQWIGGTVFPVSVSNTDPRITPRQQDSQWKMWR